MSDPAEVSRPHLAPAARAEAVWYGSAMLRTFGWFYWLLGLGYFLGRVRLEDHNVERIRTAAEDGHVVYVLLRQSTVDHLALNTVLNRRRLPLSVWANGVINFWWQPVIEAWRDVYHRLQHLFSAGLPDPVASGWLARTVAAGAPVVVFLEPRPTWLQWFRRESPADPIAALLSAQELTDKPIHLVPTVVVWDRSPDTGQNSPVLNFIEGTREAPSRNQMVRNLLFRSGDAFIQVGDPVPLPEFTERVGERPQRPQKLRVLLRRFLRREAQLVRGPRLVSYSVMKRLVLDNPPMRTLARREAEATGVDVGRVRQQMERDLASIAANFRWWVIRAIDIVMRVVVRVYSGIDVRDEDLDRIRTAMRDGSVVLVPCHKSHYDYLLISWVFYTHDLIVPHVVAGMNLAIWPVSFLLRSVGGFFIRRSFEGERIFPAVFSRYVRELIRQEYPVEFFIEGGRSRTGKLLPPRLGVLGMVLDAAAVRAKGREVTLLPIQLSYEHVVEERTYTRELGGEDKKPESMGQLMSAWSILGRRYGRVYVRVAEPIRCSELVDDLDGQRWIERSRSQQRDVLQPLGERIIHRIGHAAVVLPTSLAALSLLAHHRRGIRHTELLERMDRFRTLLQGIGAEEAASMQRFSEARIEALERFRKAGLIEALDHNGERVWGIDVDSRITLEGYKNQLIQFLVPMGLVSMAARPLPDGPFTIDDLRAGVVQLVWTLRREFILSPDHSVTAVMGDGLERLVEHGALTTKGDGRFELGDNALMGEIYGLFRHFLETYVLVLRSIDGMGGQSPEEIARALQADGPSLMTAGTVTRPEALSRVTLDNAIKSFVDDTTFTRDDSGDVHGTAKVEPVLQALAVMVD